MIKSIDEIQGWFDFEDIYRMVANTAGPRSVFLEIGAWKGKSTAFMGTIIRELRPDIKFYTVDTWVGEDSCTFQQNEVNKCGGSVFNVFWQNMVDLKLVSHVHPIMASSETCLDIIPDKKFDFIFIDADHKHPVIDNDIRRFYDVLQPNGILAGHDFSGDVKEAVSTFVKEKNITCFGHGSSWVFERKK